MQFGRRCQARRQINEPHQHSTGIGQREPSGISPRCRHPLILVFAATKPIPSDSHIKGHALILLNWTIRKCDRGSVLGGEEKRQAMVVEWPQPFEAARVRSVASNRPGDCLTSPIRPTCTLLSSMRSRKPFFFHKPVDTRRRLCPTFKVAAD